MRISKAQKIINEYGRVVGKNSSPLPFGFAPESLLPYSKKQIKDAIALMLIERGDEIDDETREGLEGAYCLLAMFVPDKDYKKVKKFADFWEEYKDMSSGQIRSKVKNDFKDNEKLAERIKEIAMSHEAGEIMNRSIREHKKYLKEIKDYNTKF